MSEDTKTEPTPAEIGKVAATQERGRLVMKLLAERTSKMADYRNTIKHTGGLLTESMTFAYAKGFEAALKLLTQKEEDNVKKSSKQA